MRRCVSFLLTILALVAFGPAQAALNLELTQGVSSALPIAVIPFAGDQQLSDNSLTQVISNDLQNSGEFRLLPSSRFPQSPSTLATVDVAQWQPTGVNDIVIGSVSSDGFHRYSVSFALINVVGGGKAQLSQDSQQVLLAQTYNVNANGLRRLAHHISDLIYQKLTGVRGIFSTKIAYILVQRKNADNVKYSLEVADADGYNPQALVVSRLPIMSPAWSPDGQSIAYVSFEGNHAAVYVQNINSGQRQKVSDAPGINGAPAFSPDGSKLALVLSKTGNPKIYVLDLKTQQLTQITKGYAIDTEPSWAPDGKSLLFTSNRGGTPQIYRYNFADGTVSRVTFDGNYNARAAYVPDESGIIMMHRETGMFGIAYQSLQSGQVQTLVQSGYDESPSLAPNGKMVIYATEFGGRGVLAQVSVDGKVKLRLPAREGTVQEPAWSPFLN